MRNSNLAAVIAIIVLFVVTALLDAHEAKAEVVHHQLGDITEESVQPIAMSTFVLGKDDTICINIDSRGGSVDAASFLGVMIEKSEAKVVAVVKGEASSAAAYLLSFAHVRMIDSNANMILHRARNKHGSIIPVGYSDLADRFNLRTILGLDEVLSKMEVTAFWAGLDVVVDKPERFRRGHAEECINK